MIGCQDRPVVIKKPLQVFHCLFGCGVCKLAEWLSKWTQQCCKNIIDTGSDHMYAF